MKSVAGLSFYIVLIFSGQSHGNSRSCVNLFTNDIEADVQPTVRPQIESAPQAQAMYMRGRLTEQLPFVSASVVAASVNKRHRAFLVEEAIREHANEAIRNLSEPERSTLRDEADQISRNVFGVDSRIDVYKRANGSLRKRIIINEARRIRMIKNHIKRGSVDLAVEALEIDFIKFESNFLLIQALRLEVSKQDPTSEEGRKVIVKKLDQLKTAETYFGHHFYRYQAIRKMLAEVKEGPIQQYSKYADNVEDRLQARSKVEANKRFLVYNRVTLKEVEAYSQFSNVAIGAMAHKAAVVEFITMIKLITFSAPVLEFARTIVGRLPSKISIPAFGEIDVRQFVSEMMMIGHHQHLRDLYTEPIEMIMAQNGRLKTQLELLVDANSISEKKDELFVTFARIPDLHTKNVWRKLLDYAKRARDKDPNDTDAADLYMRLEAANTRARQNESEFPLYNVEPGVTTVGKIASGSAAAFLAFISTNPEAANGAVSFLKGFLVGWIP